MIRCVVAFNGWKLPEDVTETSARELEDLTHKIYFIYRRFDQLYYPQSSPLHKSKRYHLAATLKLPQVLVLLLLLSSKSVFKT